MKKKQTNGLIVAAVIFIVTGVISVLTNALGNYTQQKTSTQGELKSMFGQLTDETETALSDMPTSKDFIAIVPIKGTIQASSGQQSFGASTDTYNHDLLMAYVDKLIDNEHNKGIVLKLDTPGGSVYQADEFYLRLKKYKEKTGRPIWAYMESTCCSGGVYIASASDEQYANRITETGSIGVIMSTYDLSGLYEKLGVKEVNIVSGANKDMGTPGKPMTDEQRAILQAFIDEYYNQFVEIVAEGRNMKVEDVKKLADGRIYTASQAVDNGLIDGIKTAEEFDAYVKEQSGTDVFYQPSSDSNPFSMLFGTIANISQPKSDTEILLDLAHSLENGGPMYYANPLGQ